MLGHDVEPDPGSDADWTELVAGNSTFCGIRRPGTLWCRGPDLDSRAQGLPAASVADLTQIGIDGGFDRVAAAGEHACVRRTDGAIFCVGEGSLGRLGTGDAWRDQPTAAVALP